MSAPTAADRRPPMTLWRLERARLVRTHRWLLLAGVYASLGVLGALGARYLNEIIERFGGEVTIVAPEPQPVDGLIQFVSNGAQLGILAVVVVAAGALSLDAKPELSAFLRTKVSSPVVLLLPAYVVTLLGSAVALALGTAVTWVLTESLIGALPAGPVLLGTLLGAVFLAFALAVVAAVAGFTRSQTATVLGALGALLLLPAFGVVDAVAVWLPSRLATAVVALTEGQPAGEFLRATLVSLAATAALLALAARRLSRREL